MLAVPLVGQLTGIAGFDVNGTKGHPTDRVLFSKWNSFSRVAVYERTHGDWSLSPAYQGPLPDTRFMDIDSAASTPILHAAPDLSNVQYLRYELTALAYHLKESPVASRQSPVASPRGLHGARHRSGGGRDLALRARLRRAPCGRRRDQSDHRATTSCAIGFATTPAASTPTHASASSSTTAEASCGGRRIGTTSIQASLVDTWAATAAGAYTLTENTLYTVEAFSDYLDHLNDDGVLTITRWVFDGLRLVSLAQEACAARGWDAGRGWRSSSTSASRRFC